MGDERRDPVILCARCSDRPRPRDDALRRRCRECSAWVWVEPMHLAEVVAMIHRDPEFRCNRCPSSGNLALTGSEADRMLSSYTPAEAADLLAMVVYKAGRTDAQVFADIFADRAAEREAFARARLNAAAAINAASRRN